VSLVSQEIFNSPFYFSRNVSLGGGMSTLPSHSFARFILMMYILFALIIRTGYQGVQFEMMLKEMRPRDIETIDELIDNNYTIFIGKQWFGIIKDMDFVKR
jgi:hypothetical protein